MKQTYEDYDEIAEHVFGPIYSDIASCMVERTGIRRGRMLDVGCGGGHMGLAVMALGDFRGVFCDIRPETVEQVLARARAQGLEGRVSACVEDVHSLSFPDGSFDLIVSRGSMPFWERQGQAFSELYRVLAPGGRAYVGGGQGGPKHQARIREEMARRGRPGQGFSPEQSKALPTEQYLRLFERLGGVCRAIENPEEGRWFLFGKGDAV